MILILISIDIPKYGNKKFKPKLAGGLEGDPLQLEIVQIKSELLCFTLILKNDSPFSLFFAGCQSGIKVMRAPTLCHTEMRTAAAQNSLILDDCRETHEKC